MTAPVMIEDITSQEKPKRTRKSHNKVRSGCLTCKYDRPALLDRDNNIWLTLYLGSDGRNVVKKSPFARDVRAPVGNVMDIQRSLHQRLHHQQSRPTQYPNPARND